VIPYTWPDPPEPADLPELRDLARALEHALEQARSARDVRDAEALAGLLESISADYQRIADGGGE
jgi:hypothetical protein